MACRSSPSQRPCRSPFRKDSIRFFTEAICCCGQNFPLKSSTRKTSLGKPSKPKRFTSYGFVQYALIAADHVEVRLGFSIPGMCLMVGMRNASNSDRSAGHCWSRYTNGRLVLRMMPVPFWFLELFGWSGGPESRFPCRRSVCSMLPAWSTACSLGMFARCGWGPGFCSMSPQERRPPLRVFEPAGW